MRALKDRVKQDCLHGSSARATSAHPSYVFAFSRAIRGTYVVARPPPGEERGPLYLFSLAIASIDARYIGEVVVLVLQLLTAPRTLSHYLCTTSARLGALRTVLVK